METKPERQIIEFETHESADLRELCWYQPGSRGGRYWHQNASGRWVAKSAGQFVRWLKGQGLADFIPKAEVGERVLSEVHDLLTDLESERILEWAGGVSGWQPGVYSRSGGRFLVTHAAPLLERRAPEVVPDGAQVWDAEAWGWPVLHQVLGGMLNGVEADETGMVEAVVQLPRLIAWLRHFLESLYAGTYSTGLALALASEPEAGKTLFAQLLAELSGGVVARPYRYMVGQDNFNEEWLESALLLVDDENSDTHIQGRLKFGAELKQIVASRGTRIRGMHQKALLLHPIQRLVICVNLEPERLQVLPPIDTDIRDKILALKCYAQPMPMPAHTPAQQEAFWSCLMGELPCFLHWLLEVYEPDASQMGRFGPRAWQHPEILEELGKLSPEARTMEFIERLLERHRPALTKEKIGRLAAADQRPMLRRLEGGRELSGWVGTVSDLRAALVADGDQACLSMLERREVRATAYLGRDLVALSKRYPQNIWQSRSALSGARNWVILPTPMESEPESVTA